MTQGGESWKECAWVMGCAFPDLQWACPTVDGPNLFRTTSSKIRLPCKYQQTVAHHGFQVQDFVHPQYVCLSRQGLSQNNGVP